MFTINNETYTLAEMLEVNAHDESACEWLNSARIGDTFGGGNSEYVTRIA